MLAIACAVVVLRVRADVTDRRVTGFDQIPRHIASGFHIGITDDHVDGTIGQVAALDDGDGGGLQHPNGFVRMGDAGQIDTVDTTRQKRAHQGLFLGG